MALSSAMQRNPLVDELTEAAKAELSVLFAELKRHYPPVCYTPIGSTLRLLGQQRQPWNRL